MSTSWPLLFAFNLGIWPVWNWYIQGTLDGSNDPWGLLALVTAIMVLKQKHSTVKPAYPLVLPGLFLLLYMVAGLWELPLSLRGALGFIALATLFSSYRMGRYLNLSLILLFLLSLPLTASLQFYLGYPLRVLAGQLSVMLLQMNGLAVEREGTLLLWAGQHIAIDAPCSGIRMLWTGIYLVATSTAFYRFSNLQTLAALFFGTLVVIAANGLRSASLFYLETGLLALPNWAHAGTGMVVFLFAGFLILAGTQWIRLRSGIPSCLVTISPSGS